MGLNGAPGHVKAGKAGFINSGRPRLPIAAAHCRFIIAGRSERQEEFFDWRSDPKPR